MTLAEYALQWLDLSCIGWICLALARSVLHWLDMSCIGWICLALARFVLHWLNLSFIGWICLALAPSVLHWLDLSSVAENSLETGWELLAGEFILITARNFWLGLILFLDGIVRTTDKYSLHLHIQWIDGTVGLICLSLAGSVLHCLDQRCIVFTCCIFLNCLALLCLFLLGCSLADSCLDW